MNKIFPKDVFYLTAYRKSLFLLIKSFKIGLACLFLLMGGLVFSETIVQIDTYEEAIDFSGQPVVVIQKGDSEQFKDPDFNDSDWEVTSLPSNWSAIYPDYNGICWYRIHFRFPKELPTHALGINLGTITDADETYFNGKLIGQSGNIKNPEISAYDKLRLYEIPTNLIRPGEDNVLSIRVRGLFAYTNGPFSGSFILGNYSKLLSNLLSFDFSALFLVIVYLVVFAYFLLFFIRRPKDKANLLFSFFALAMGLYFAFRSQGKYLIGADFFITKKIEYLVLTLLVLLIMEFLTVYFKRKHTLAHYIFWGLTAVHFGVFLFTGDYRFWDWYNQYIQAPSWILGAALSFIVLISNLKKNRDARLMFYALIILVLTMLNDIFLNMALYNFVRLSSYGFLFFVMSIAVILSNSFVQLYNEVADLNRNLEIRVEDRTKVLNETVVNLEEAQTETNNLLLNVKEGIFLMEKDFLIGDHHSRMLETIFVKEDMAGVDFINLIKDVADEKTAQQTEEFLNIALNKRLSDKRLSILNPLDEIPVMLKGSEGIIDKFVRFNFTRIGEKGHYSHILATVQDATEEKLLEKKIKDSEIHAQDEMKLLLGILHLRPEVVRQFIVESGNEISLIEKNLEAASFTEDLYELLNTVYRSVHSIKGNASVLALDLFSEKAHQFEDQIAALLKKEKLIHLNLLDLLYSIVGIKDALKEVEDLLARITGFQSEFGSGSGTMDEREILMQVTRELAERVAERESKEVSVVFEDFDLLMDGSIDISSLKKILVQLVKNAVSHGIETPEERESVGKIREGKITINAIKAEGSMVCTVKDDGKGLNLDKLRQKAIEKGLYTEAELKTWSPKKMLQLLFVKGLSSRNNISLDSGRGIGLDVVRDEVKKRNGVISLSSIPGKQTRFTLKFPDKVV